VLEKLEASRRAVGALAREEPRTPAGGAAATPGKKK
jgi:hypothetical protein